MVVNSPFTKKTVPRMALILALLGTPLFSGKPDIPKPVYEKKRYWIYFKPEVIPRRELDRRLDALAHRLSERCLERRRKVIDREPPMRRCDLPPSTERLRAVEQTGAKIVRVLHYVNAVTVQGNTAALERIADLPEVGVIEPVKQLQCPPVFGVNAPTPAQESPHRPGTTSNPDLYGVAWLQTALVNVPAAHEAGFRGEGVLIGVQDAGFDNLDHNCFRYLQIEAAYDFLNGDPNVADEGDIGSGRHGTRTLSVIAGLDSGRFIGSAPDARYVLTKTESSVWERPIEEDVWVEGLWFHDSLGVDVLSSSLSYRAWYDYRDLDGETAVTTRAADSAAAAGMVIVNSMGNTGREQYPASKLGAPADGRLVLGAGGVVADSGSWSGSSHGPTYDRRIKPDLSAMSSGVQTAANLTDDNYASRSGTSYSCPMIAGVAALTLQANPALTPRQVIEILHSTADQADSPDTVRGWGVPNALAAVRRAEAMSVDRPEFLPGSFGFDAFPNPFNRTLIVTLPKSSNYDRIRAYNLMGRIIWERTTPIAGREGIITIDFGGMPAGMYLLEFRTAEKHILRRVQLLR